MKVMSARFPLVVGIWIAHAEDHDRVAASLALDTSSYDCGVSLLQSQYQALPHALASQTTGQWMQREALPSTNNDVFDSSLLQRRSERVSKVEALRQEVRQLQARLLQHMAAKPTNATQRNTTLTHRKKSHSGPAANDKLTWERLSDLSTQAYHTKKTLLVALVAAVPPLTYFLILMCNRLRPGRDQSQSGARKNTSRWNKLMNHLHEHHKFRIGLLLVLCVSVSFLAVAAYFGILGEISSQILVFGWMAIIVITVVTLAYSEFIAPTLERLSSIVEAQHALANQADSVTKVLGTSRSLGTSKTIKPSSSRKT